MIKTFRHKGPEDYFRADCKAGAQPRHAGKLRLLLTTLDSAKRTEDMNAPEWQLHPLTGDTARHWSVWVKGKWRTTFRFEGGDVVPVNYLDYH